MIARQLARNDSDFAPAHFVTIDGTSSLDQDILAVLAPLESFMRKLCILIEEHPEWRYQSAHERMENVLEALQRL